MAVCLPQRAAARGCWRPITVLSAVRSRAEGLDRLRLYHSASAERNGRPEAGAAAPAFSATESTILGAAMKHVPTLGFTRDALVQGARDSGYPDVSINLFPRGAFDLIHFHLVRERLALKDKVRFHDGSGGGDHTVTENPKKELGVGSKIRALAWARLSANAEAGIVGRWAEALAIMAQPSYASASLEELALLADEMWHLAGDKDVSFAWYTKRASLSAVYASADLYMTQDTSASSSPPYKETQRFLDRRLADVQSAGYVVGSVGEWAGFSASALINVLRSKGVRI